MKTFIQKHKNLLLITLIAFFMMFFCSTSSPLYYANNWVDINAYLTMGLGLFHGKILYLELFDHKGPLLYFIYGVAGLLSKGYFGLYLIESIFFTFTLYYAFKIANLFLNEPKSYLTLFMLLPFVFIYKLFVLGGSAEEFIIPIMFISIFYSLSILKNNFNKKYFYIIGLCLAAIILIKFTITIFMLPFLIAILIHTLRNQKFSKTTILIGYALLGFLTIFLPFIFYFLITHSFKAFFTAYIHFNSLYAKVQINRKGLLTLTNALSTIINNNFSEILIILYGGFYFIFNHFFKNKNYNLLFLLSWFILFITIYSGGIVLPYNFLIFIPFIFLGLIAIVKTLKLERLNFEIIIPICILLSFVAIILNSNYNNFSSKITHYNDNALALMTKDLKKENAKSILEYNTLDIGLYNRLNIIPNVQYFYLPNISYKVYPQVFKEQNRYLKEKLTDYVVTRIFYENIDSNNNFPGINTIQKNYKLYKYYDSQEEGFRYYLFKKIN